MARRKTPITLRQLPNNGPWQALARDATVVAQAHSIRALRNRLPDVLGEDVEIEEKLELYPAVQKELDELHADVARLQELADRVRERRLRVANKLLMEMRIGQLETAALMRMTQSYLNKILVQESTGQLPATTRARRTTT